MPFAPGLPAAPEQPAAPHQAEGKAAPEARPSARTAAFDTEVFGSATSSLLPGLVGMNLATAGSRAPGAGGRALSAIAALGEGAGQGLADETEQASYENRPVELGNVLLYGVGGELVGRAIPFAARRTAAKFMGSEPLAAITGEVAENVAAKAEQRSLTRAARDATGMPKGPERDALLVKTAGQQYDRAAQEARQALDGGTARFARIADPPPGKVRGMVAPDAPVQMRWGSDTAEELGALAQQASGKTRRALQAAARDVGEPTKGADIFVAARAARKALEELPEGVERNAAIGALRRGTERADLWGKAAEFESDMNRTLDRFGPASKEIRRALAQGDTFDPAKLRSALKQDKLGRGVLQERVEQTLQAMEDQAQVATKWNTAGEGAIEAMRSDVRKVRAAFAMADDVQAAQASRTIAEPRAKEPAAPAAPAADGFAQQLAGEALETGADMALGTFGMPPVAGIAMNLMRRLNGNGRAAIAQTARRIVRPIADESTAPVRPALAATAISRFQGEYPGPRESFEAKRETLLQMQRDPGLVAQAVAESFGTLPAENPELMMKLAGRLDSMFQYVSENLPASIATSIRYPLGVPPSDTSIRDFAMLWNSVMDPESVLDDLEDGSATPAQVRYLRDNHQDIYQALLNDVVTEVSSNFEEMSSQTKQWLDILFDTDGLAGPCFTWAAADYMAAAPQPSKKAQAASVEPEALAPTAAGLNALASSVTNRGA